MATAARGRPFVMPDPDDRSPNQPHTIVERQAVLGLFNQSHPGAEAQNVTQNVRDWFETEAKAEGWAEIIWVDNNTAMLKANVVRQ